MNDKRKRILVTAVCIVIGAFSDGLAVKAAVGTSSYEALALSINQVSGIKVGTAAIMMNISCIILQLILKRKFTPDMMLQIPVALVQGELLNFVVYNIYRNLIFTSWLASVIAASAGLAVSGVVMGIMLGEEIVCFPLQQLCKAVSDKTYFSFAKVQQAADITNLILAVVISLLSHTPVTVREGTVIAMLIQGPITGAFQKYIEKANNHKIPAVQL